ncbi:hypothetical protein HN873_015663 [Arachis hypogaea]
MISSGNVSSCDGSSNNDVSSSGVLLCRQSCPSCYYAASFSSSRLVSAFNLKWFKANKTKSIGVDIVGVLTLASACKGHSLSMMNYAFSGSLQDKALMEDPIYEEFWQKDVEESIRQENAKEAALQVSNWGFSLLDLKLQKKK